MKLLFDQNLSFKLCRRLADVFPESDQIRLLGMAEAMTGASGTTPKPMDSFLFRRTLISPTWQRFTDRRRKLFGCAVATNPPRQSSEGYVITPKHSPPSSRIKQPRAGRFTRSFGNRERGVKRSLCPRNKRCTGKKHAGGVRTD